MLGKHWSARAASALAAGLFMAGLAQGADPLPKPKGSDTTVVRPGELTPPRVAEPCRPGRCPFAGQHLTVLVVNGQPTGGPMLEIKQEFEAATGATLEFVRLPLEELFDNLISDLTLADPRHRAAFQKAHGYPLAAPATWEQFRDVAEYFNGRDLNGDGEPDHGVLLPLRAGAQGMFHFMSLSAPFVIGPSNPRLYWFDPQTMKPLLDSPGHVRALTVLVDLVQFGPKEMLNWDLGRSWDYFLSGRAALTLTWGDLGALAQQPGSRVRGKVGSAQLPGTPEYYEVGRQQWTRTQQPSRVGNTTGGSWSGVISRFSKAPAAPYYLLAMMASEPKSRVQAGWDSADVRDYLQAYDHTFSNPRQLPYLRISGAFSYWQLLDLHLAAAAAGHLSPEAALKAASVDFEEITVRLGRQAQRGAYRASLGLPR